MLKLYYHPLSTFSRRIRMAFLEKGLDAELVPVNMGQGEHKADAYRALNPYARIPTLVDGDFVLYETTAILDYLEALYPTPPLVPKDARGRALVAMHVKLCDLEFSRFTRELFFPRRFHPRERWNLAEQDAARAQMQQHLGVLDRQLKGKRFLVADTYSLAELCYTPFLDFLPLLELEAPTNVAEWMTRLQARPSAQATKLER